MVTFDFRISFIMLIRLAPPGLADWPMARPDFPRTIIEFQAQFPDERACWSYLVECRWPEGYRCPRCGPQSAALLSARRLCQLGTHRGVSGEHLQVYLDKFTFRFNRRRTPMAAFLTLLGLESQQQPSTYKQVVAKTPDDQQAGAELTG